MKLLVSLLFVGIALARFAPPRDVQNDVWNHPQTMSFVVSKPGAGGQPWLKVALSLFVSDGDVQVNRQKADTGLNQASVVAIVAEFSPEGYLGAPRRSPINLEIVVTENTFNQGKALSVVGRVIDVEGQQVEQVTFHETVILVNEDGVELKRTISEISDVTTTLDQSGNVVGVEGNAVTEVQDDVLPLPDQHLVDPMPFVDPQPPIPDGGKPLPDVFPMPAIDPPMPMPFPIPVPVIEPPMPAVDPMYPIDPSFTPVDPSVTDKWGTVGDNDDDNDDDDDDDDDDEHKGSHHANHHDDDDDEDDDDDDEDEHKEDIHKNRMENFKNKLKEDGNRVKNWLSKEGHEIEVEAKEDARKVGSWFRCAWGWTKRTVRRIPLPVLVFVLSFFASLVTVFVTFKLMKWRLDKNGVVAHRYFKNRNYLYTSLPTFDKEKNIAGEKSAPIKDMPDF